MRKWGVVFFVVLFAAALSVSAPAHAQKNSAASEATQAAAAAAGAATASGGSDYVLGVGDKIKVTVFGETDLSGPLDVSSTGTVSMPLIGDMKAAGLTVSKLQAIITGKLADGYMKDPKVNVEVSNYRPFFIVGEVMKPGSYDYVNGMTVITAIAMAGGYTYRADKGDIGLKHNKGAEEKVSEDASVHPGDVIRVPERFF